MRRYATAPRASAADCHLLPFLEDSSACHVVIVRTIRPAISPLAETKRFDSLPRWVTSISTTSPSLRKTCGLRPAPTPAGVPVENRSPGRKRYQREFAGSLLSVSAFRAKIDEVKFIEVLQATRAGMAGRTSGRHTDQLLGAVFRGRTFHNRPLCERTLPPFSNLRSNVSHFMHPVLSFIAEASGCTWG
jgi:hypothetical protein